MLFFLLSGLFLGIGALFPETYLCLLLFVLSAVCFKLALTKSEKIYLGSFLSGFVFHAVAFYWLFSTVKVFGGLNLFLAFLVFMLFCTTAALQFLLAAFFYKKIGGQVAIAWMSASIIWPKLFPWEIGHSLIVIPEISALASVLGVIPLSGLLVWFASSLVDAVKFKKIIQPAFILVLLVFILGFFENRRISKELVQAKEAVVALVQGNLSIKEKGKQKYFDANLNSYLELSKFLETDLIVWPESVVSAWVPEQLSNIEELGLGFHKELKAPLLFGTLGFSRRGQKEMQTFVNNNPELANPEFLQNYSIKKYNTAVAVEPNGEIKGRYYKKVLMPFGEYLPFSDLYPKIKTWFPMVGDFSKGELEKTINFSEIKSFVLICYEDLVPSMTRLAVKNGANLLINLTNDAWYGHTQASQQHHLLAAFRAIESRRYFLRATNTGYTAIVNPFGKTVKKLEIFTSNVLVDKVKLLNLRTLYSYLGDFPLYVFIGIFFIRNLLSPQNNT